MPRRAARILATLFVLLLGACQQKEQSSSLRVAVGQSFPNLVVLDLAGNKHTLNFAGDKVTVLNVWATWCAPCRHEMPSLQRLAEKLGSNYQVIGISVDDDDHIVREFLIDKKIHFNNYLDPHMKAANESIGVRAFPSTFIINSRGKLVHMEEAWRYWDEPESVRQIQDKAG